MPHSHPGVLPDLVAFDRTDFDREQFTEGCGFLTGRLRGQFAMGQSSIGDIGLELAGITRLQIMPGTFPDFIPAPPAAGLLVPGRREL